MVIRIIVVLVGEGNSLSICWDSILGGEANIVGTLIDFIL